MLALNVVALPPPPPLFKNVVAHPPQSFPKPLILMDYFPSVVLINTLATQAGLALSLRASSQLPLRTRVRISNKIHRENLSLSRRQRRVMFAKPRNTENPCDGCRWCHGAARPRLTPPHSLQ